jgi:hypothetical protein
MRPGKTHYQGPDGKQKTGSAFFVNIEFRQQDYSQLVPSLLSHSLQYEQSLHEGRKLIAQNVDEDDESIEVEQLPEVEQAKAMTSEFYPENRTETAASAGTVTNVPLSTKPETTAEVDEDEAISARMFKKLRLNPVQQESLKQSLKGDVSEIRKWIVEFAAGVERTKLTHVQVLEFYTRMVVQPKNLKKALEQIVLVTPRSETPTVTKLFRAMV